MATKRGPKPGRRRRRVVAPPVRAAAGLAKAAELDPQNEELRTAREMLEAALERYTEVFDFAPIGYATLDLHGHIVEINHTGGELLGAGRGTLVGERFGLFVAARSLPGFDSLLETAISRSTSATAELELRRNNELFSARLTAAVLRRVTPTYMIAFEDISVRRQKEAELARIEAALRDLDRRRDDFVAMLSHELRNPLSPIRTSVEVLRLAPPGSERAVAAIDIIDRSSSHMTQLVDDLLDVSRITRGKIELQREPVELVGLIKQMLDDHQALFDRRRFDVVANIDPTELWVCADRARFVQVLTSLLANAEKLTPPGGRITIGVERAGGSAMIRVADNGVGNAPDLLSELFQPFAQAQPLDRNRGGLGLDLVMAKHLIELHGGRVVIRSAGIGKGTEVMLSLPAQGPQRPHEPAASVGDACGKRVLIVEDMQDHALSLEQALILKGHEVRIAHDGWAGLRQMATFRPDVVLCNIGLPDMDGYAFALRVREDAELRHCYLVALSGYTRAEAVARARAAGFDRHLAKPASLDELDRMLLTLPLDPQRVGEHDTVH